jgi:hypothetical protein
MRDSAEEARFIGTWEASGGAVWVFQENGNVEISESPVSLTWRIQDGHLIVNSIFNIFYIKAQYSFVSDGEVELYIVDASPLADSYDTGAGSRYSLYKQ